MSPLLIVRMFCRCLSQLDKEDYKTLQDDKLQIKFVNSIPFLSGSNSGVIKTKELQFSILLPASVSYPVFLFHVERSARSVL